MKRKKLAIVVTEDWVFVSHRLALGIAAKKEGFDVVVITRCKKFKNKIIKSGLRLINLKINRSEKSIIGLAKESFELFKIYKKENPNLVHHVGLRPIIIGSIASKIAGIKNTVATFTGMGFLFTNERKSSFISKILMFFLPWLLKDSFVSAQNKEDYNFLKINGIKKEKIQLIKGAGVNLNKYKYVPEPKGVPVVLMHSRILWDKGVSEFIEAARLCQKLKCNSKFVLAGMPDPKNPSSVPKKIWKKWRQDKTVNCIGHKTQKQLMDILPKSSIVCLPSYREGVPKSLLEGISCGRPIVATNIAGCREVVRQGVNGYLVPPKKSWLLAKAIIKLAKNFQQRRKMGQLSRKIAEQKFSEEIINKKTILLYKKVLLNNK